LAQKVNVGVTGANQQQMSGGFIHPDMLTPQPSVEIQVVAGLTLVFDPAEFHEQSVELAAHTKAQDGFHPHKAQADPHHDQGQPARQVLLGGGQEV
jgi:hypothetical protein